MLVSTSELQASDRCLKRPFFNVGALCKFHVIERDRTHVIRLRSLHSIRS